MRDSKYAGTILAPDRASVRAVEYMADLWMERSNKSTREQVVAWGLRCSRKTVSDRIEWLLDQPKLVAEKSPVDVAAGRYAVTGLEGQTVFVKVDRPSTGRWAGRTFVKVQAGSDFLPTFKETQRVLLERIVEDGPKEAMLRYGQEIGSCGHCGRTLTNEESRRVGIGPVCREKMGW